MRYIREKADPLNIIAFGNVSAGGLGEWAEALYEEVEGSLPDGYKMISPQRILSGKDITNFLIEQFKNQDPPLRIQLLQAIEWEWKALENDPAITEEEYQYFSTQIKTKLSGILDTQIVAGIENNLNEYINQSFKFAVK